jgi:hypothetical protein
MERASKGVYFGTASGCELCTLFARRRHCKFLADSKWARAASNLFAKIFDVAGTLARVHVGTGGIWSNSDVKLSLPPPLPITEDNWKNESARECEDNLRRKARCPGGSRDKEMTPALQHEILLHSVGMKPTSRVSFVDYYIILVFK